MDSTTHNNPAETTGPVCPRCGCSDDAPNSHDLCENCVDSLGAEATSNCTNCGLPTDEVGPLCATEGRWHGMCEECCAEICADEDFAERGGYD